MPLTSCEQTNRDMIVELEGATRQQIQTERKLAELSNQMQQLAITRPPRFLRFFTWQTMELLALGTMVAGAAAVVQYQKTTNAKLTEQLDIQRTTLEQLNTTLTLTRQEQQSHKRDTLFLYDNLETKLKEQHSSFRDVFNDHRHQARGWGCECNGLVTAGPSPTIQPNP
jgi:hypothetical protein